MKRAAPMSETSSTCIGWASVKSCEHTARQGLPSHKQVMPCGARAALAACVQCCTHVSACEGCYVRPMASQPQEQRANVVRMRTLHGLVVPHVIRHLALWQVGAAQEAKGNLAILRTRDTLRFWCNAYCRMISHDLRCTWRPLCLVKWPRMSACISCSPVANLSTRSTASCPRSRECRQ